MAADKPAKAPPLYEGGGPKSTKGWGQLDDAARSGMVNPMNFARHMAFAAAIAALSGACSKAESAGDKAANAAPALPTPVEPAPQAFAVDEKSDLLDFHYGWSKEVSAIPALAGLLQADMDKIRGELMKSAADDKAARAKSGFEFHPYDSSTSYDTAGQSATLLSLRADHGEYTGGAHPNSMTSALMWDRTRNQEIKFASLFTSAENRDRLLLQRWCDALNKAREEKRGTPVGGDGMFDECPKLDDIAIIPTDKDSNGRFERLALIASPYVAGPYVEGSYEIELAVTPDLIAALREEFQGSFEAAQDAQ